MMKFKAIIHKAHWAQDRNKDGRFKEGWAKTIHSGRLGHDRSRRSWAYHRSFDLPSLIFRCIWNLMGNLVRTGPKVRGTAADFIRKHPQLKANELVKLGRKKGFKIYPNRVHTVRYVDRKKGRSRPTTGSFSAAERAWLKLGVETIGLARAKEVLGGTERRSRGEQARQARGTDIHRGQARQARSPDIRGVIILTSPPSGPKPRVLNTRGSVFRG